MVLVSFCGSALGNNLTMTSGKAVVNIVEEQEDGQAACMVQCGPDPEVEEDGTEMEAMINGPDTELTQTQRWRTMAKTQWQRRMSQRQRQ